ncbi:MAG TPA: branched-chain-amino-acid transaminase [Streptosporangiaceae bacterium]|nr:branched-chain-amino-acid transaminase [Streptosporangiaceae bacterium]HYB73564.1 branched-chain-amino-acid transaminase [Candidatus Sulfotelmatobacter sp.]
MSDAPQYVWFNGRVVPYDQGRIHVQSAAMKFGAAVYEGLRGYWNADARELYVFRQDAHVQRLCQSLKLMRMEAPFAPAQMREAVLEVLRANNFREDVHIRQSAFLEGDSAMTSTGPVGMAVAAYPMGRIKNSEAGLHYTISSWLRIPDSAMPPRLKCIANYHNGRLAALQARADGYDGTFLLNSRGKISETPGATMFLVRGGRPITPSITSDILEGVTRDTLIRLLAEVHGLAVEERDVDRTEVYVADEVFVCGSAYEVTPVVSVDRYTVGDGRVGPLTKAILATYLDAARGQVPARRDWLTPTYGNVQ